MLFGLQGYSRLIFQITDLKTIQYLLHKIPDDTQLLKVSHVSKRYSRTIQEIIITIAQFLRDKAKITEETVLKKGYHLMY